MSLMPRRLNDQGNNNWRRLCESNIKSHLQAARAWLQRLSTSPSSPRTLSVPPFAFDYIEAVIMSSNPVIQSLKEQFLYWCHDMEKKQEEQAKQMMELQAHAKRLQRENDQLRAQMEKSRDLGNEVRDSGRAGYLITHNKGKEPVIPSNVDTPVNDELSSANSPPLGLSPAKNTRPSGIKGPRIALSSVMPLVTCFTEQEEKQAGGRGQY